MNSPIDAVRLENVTKTFGPITALDGLHIRIPRGVVYGVLGPNGAGKTTAIRAIAGLVDVETGSVEILGGSPSDRSVQARLGYMPQSPALYEELTVRENVAFFSACYGAESTGDQADAIALAGLADRADSPIRTLSGGMRQRASLAYAITHNPELLLLDEPTAGVDPQLRMTFWEHFRKMASTGTTILVSSHIMDEAERCDRLGLILGGKLLAEGTANDIQKQAAAANLEEAFIKLSEQDSHGQ